MFYICKQTTLFGNFSDEFQLLRVYDKIIIFFAISSKYIMLNKIKADRLK